MREKWVSYFVLPDTGFESDSWVEGEKIHLNKTNTGLFT